MQKQTLERLTGPWLVATFALAAVAYRDLLRFESAAELPEELQSWLFMPADTSAPVVLLLAGWLFYRRRHRFFALVPSPGPVWLSALFFAAGMGLYAWASYTAAPDLLVPSLMLNALGLGNLFGGPAALRVLAVPVGFLVFAIPIPGPLLNAIVFRFQLWTAELTGSLLYAAGLPAYVSGDQIFREGNTFTIVEGCSGLRSVETLTMLSVLMADLFRRRGWHAVLLVVAAPFLAFFLNGWRAVFLMLNPLAGTTAVHNAQGIAILLAGLMLLFALDGALAWALGRRAAPASPRSAAPSGDPSLARAVAATAVFALSLVVGAAVPTWQSGVGGIPRLQPRIPREVAGWKGVELDTDYGVFLGRVGFAQRLERRYVRGRDRVELFVGLSDHDRQRASLSAKTLYPGSGWIVEESGRQLVAPVGREVDYRVLRSGSARVLVYHWRDGSQGLVQEALRSALALDRSPLRRSRPALVVRMSTPVGPPTPDNRQAAEERLAAFSEAIGDALAPLGGAGKDFPENPELGKSFPSKPLLEVSKNQ